MDIYANQFTRYLFVSDRILTLVIVVFGGVLYVQSTVFFIYQKGQKLASEGRRFSLKNIVFIAALVYIFIDVYIISFLIKVMQAAVAFMSQDI